MPTLQVVLSTPPFSFVNLGTNVAYPEKKLSSMTNALAQDHFREDTEAIKWLPSGLGKQKRPSHSTGGDLYNTLLAIMDSKGQGFSDQLNLILPLHRS